MKDESTPQQRRRLNELNGKTWTRYSISIWDVKKTLDETRLKHPALFPEALVLRLLEIFTRPGDLVLDPFMGAGSTLLAAQSVGRKGIGFEIAPHYIALAHKRLEKASPQPTSPASFEIFAEDARTVTQHLSPDSIDLVVTSPPYWDIHHQQRSADRKRPRPYSSSPHDLGNITKYTKFLQALETVFEQLFVVLKPGRWSILVVMDLRKRNRFYPFHQDCISRMTAKGFTLEDIIIWDRRHDYHNLRPLGYPTTFRVNKVHEYILIFQKPLAPAPKP